jgi:1-acyl-sn-glycerol-3-phosphate acyltransferase
MWRIDISGLKNIRRKQPYIIVSNHQSALDILLLYRLLTHFKWVAKKELFRVPIIGWNLWLNRYITIDRNSPKDAIRMIKRASEHLNMGSSVLLFPEGTRTTDGRVKRFKDGAFLLAKKTSYPILPVVIDGTLKVLPKNGFIISGKQTFRLRVLPEIPANTFANMEPSEMAKYVHNIMLEKHKEMAPNYYTNSKTDND